MSKKLIIERLRDWSYGAFLNETDTTCIAIGFTEEEARENGERELKRRNSFLCRIGLHDWEGKSWPYSGTTARCMRCRKLKYEDS